MYNKQLSTPEEQEFLKSYNADKYPRPSVTADNLIFSFQGENPPEILLIKRKNHPEKGKWALPGGYANPDETVMSAAARELEEETHISGLPLYPVGIFSDIDRDPRSWTMTSAYVAAVDKSTLDIKADDDAACAEWFSVKLDLQNEICTLKLCSESGEQLVSTLNCRKTDTLFGAVYDISIISDGSLAFDHSKIIASAMMLFKDRGIAG